MGIHSVLALPELIVAQSRPEVWIRRGTIALPRPPATVSCVTDEGVQLHYEGTGSFLIRAGREILVDPAPRIEEPVLRLFILGAALGVVLHQRGRLVLHASAVAVGGKAVALLAPSGGGKSTLAAALHRRGHDIVADDVLAVDASGATTAPVVFPGFPQVKLWPEAVTALGDALESLPHLRPGLEKRARRVTRGFSHEPVPLKRIYVLAEAESTGIELLPPQEAMLELIRHSYCTRLLQSVGAESHFRQCANVANQIGVRRLRVQRSLARLPELARRLEEDLAGC